MMGELAAPKRQRFCPSTLIKLGSLGKRFDNHRSLPTSNHKICNLQMHFVFYKIWETLLLFHKKTTMKTQIVVISTEPYRKEIQ